MEVGSIIEEELNHYNLDFKIVDNMYRVTQYDKYYYSFIQDSSYIYQETYMLYTITDIPDNVIYRDIYVNNRMDDGRLLVIDNILYYDYQKIYLDYIKWKMR